MIALAFALASLAAAAPGPYPSKQVLDAFGELCRDLRDLEATEAKAKSIGWTGFTPDSSSPVGELVEFGMTEGKKIVAAKGGSISPMRIMRRTVAGEELVAVFSGVTMDGAKVNGCRVYDVGETRRITRADAERWSGRAPSRAQEDAVIAVAAWEPGYAPEHDSLEVFFVPPGSPAITFVKVSGIALKADFVGATD